jgi:hypothetical protein
MHVQIHEARHDPAPSGVDDSHLFAGQSASGIRSNATDALALDDDVGNGIKAT